MNNLTKNIILTPFNILYKINPKIALKTLFRLKCGYNLNLQNPCTYNEKLQWIKLYDRNPLMPICCDKYAVRQYVADKGLTHLLNGLLWEGFDPEEIPFDSLPDKFVIKATHGSSFNIICTDKDKLDREKTIKTCKRWLKEKFLPCYGEWFYGIEKPRIIVENYLDDHTGRLRDYKVYCFNGIPRFIGVDFGDETHHYKDIYNTKWELQEGYEMAYANNGQPLPKPEKLEEMLAYAETLSSDFNHARIDFYIVENNVLFGEMTFTNSAGFGKVKPEKFALEMGDYLKLPIDGGSK